MGLATGEILFYEAELGHKVYHFLCPLFEKLGALRQIVWLSGAESESLAYPDGPEDDYASIAELGEVSDITKLIGRLEVGNLSQSNEIETELEDLIIDVGKSTFAGEGLCRFLDLSSTRDVNEELRYGGILESSKMIDSLIGTNVVLWEEGSPGLCVGPFSYAKLELPNGEDSSKRSITVADTYYCRDKLSLMVFSECGSASLYSYKLGSHGAPPVLRVIESISRKIFTAIAVLSNEISVLESIYSTISKSIASKVEVYKNLSEEMASLGGLVTDLLFFLVAGRGIDEVCEQFLIREVCDTKKFQKWSNSLKQNFENLRLNIYRRCIPILQHLLLCVLDIKSWSKCNPLLDTKLDIEIGSLSNIQDSIHVLILTLSELEGDSVLAQRYLGSFCNWLLKESLYLESGSHNNEAIDTEYGDFVISDAVLFVCTFFCETPDAGTEDIMELLESLVVANRREFTICWGKYFSDGDRPAPPKNTEEPIHNSSSHEYPTKSHSIWMQFDNLKSLLLNALRSIACSGEAKYYPQFAIKLQSALPVECTGCTIELAPQCSRTSTFASGSTFIVAHISALSDNPPAICLNIQSLECSKAVAAIQGHENSSAIPVHNLKLLLNDEATNGTQKHHTKNICIIDILLYSESIILLLFSQTISSGKLTLSKDMGLSSFLLRLRNNQLCISVHSYFLNSYTSALPIASPGSMEYSVATAVSCAIHYNACLTRIKGDSGVHPAI